jgi:hypothetical protein
MYMAEGMDPRCLGGRRTNGNTTSVKTDDGRMPKSTGLGRDFREQLFRGGGYAAEGGWRLAVVQVFLFVRKTIRNTVSQSSMLKNNNTELSFFCIVLLILEWQPMLFFFFLRSFSSDENDTNQRCALPIHPPVRDFFSDFVIACWGEGIGAEDERESEFAWFLDLRRSLLLMMKNTDYLCMGGGDLK